MKKIRVGVTGVGYLGRFHAQKYAAMKGVKLVGVSDIDAERAQVVARECATSHFADYTGLLSEVDAVSIVVPTVQHHEVAVACLEQGVDILVEKPFTYTVRRGRGSGRSGGEEQPENRSECLRCTESLFA